MDRRALACGAVLWNCELGAPVGAAGLDVAGALREKSPPHVAKVGENLSHRFGLQWGPSLRAHDQRTEGSLQVASSMSARPMSHVASRLAVLRRCGSRKARSGELADVGCLACRRVLTAADVGELAGVGLVELAGVGLVELAGVGLVELAGLVELVELAGVVGSGGRRCAAAMMLPIVTACIAGPAALASSASCVRDRGSPRRRKPSAKPATTFASG